MALVDCLLLSLLDISHSSSSEALPQGATRSPRLNPKGMMLLQGCSSSRCG